MTGIVLDEAAIAALLADPQKVETILLDLEKINFTGAVEAFRAGDTDAILSSVENLLGFLSLFVPQAQIASYVVLGILLANKAREAGYWRPGEPGDPAMDKAAGPENA